MKSSTTIGVLATCMALHSGFALAESNSSGPIVAAPTSRTTTSSVAETVAAVRGVFADKCSGCHGPDLVRPRGRFGYVLDLHRIAENPEMVIPSSPDESELWQLVKHGEMPPPDAPRGPLSEAQKNIIRAWIADGAQDIPAPATAQSPRVGEANRIDSVSESPPVAVSMKPSEDTTPAPSSVIPRELLWFGRFHLLAIHFPIALMIAAFIGEAWSVWRRSRVHLQSVNFCVRLAAIAAIPTVTFGWLYAAAGNGAASLQLLTIHRWLGSTTGACIVAAAVCCELDRRRGVRSRRFRVLLATAVLLTIATAHFGALVVHGPDFFDW